MVVEMLQTQHRDRLPEEAAGLLMVAGLMVA
jgi:hypothetical protein